MKRIDLTGKVFGRLTVLELHSSSRGEALRWICKCECGTIKSILGTHLKGGKIVSCGCYSKQRSKDALGEYVGDLSGAYWHSHVVRSANGDKGRRVPLELTITKEYAWDLFLKQNRRCALSGIEIFFPEKWNSNYTVSLDRIDSGKGYVEGNVQWVHKDINMMKRIYSNRYFIDMCIKVAEYTKEPKET
jgi:hypothetical protein